MLRSERQRASRSTRSSGGIALQQGSAAEVVALQVERGVGRRSEARGDAVRLAQPGTGVIARAVAIETAQADKELETLESGLSVDVVRRAPAGIGRAHVGTP